MDNILIFLLSIASPIVAYKACNYIQDQLVFKRHCPWFLEKDKSEYALPIKEVTYKGHDGINMYTWYVKHSNELEISNSMGVIIFFHGNFRSISSWMKFAERYYNWGYSVFMIEYRGYGKCPGVPTEYDLFKDAEYAYRYVNEELGYPNTKIILNGISLGGAIAINLGAKVSTAAVIIDSSFTNLPDLMNRLIPYIGFYICNYAFNSIDDIKKIKSPVLIIHSKNDWLIPFKMGKNLYLNANNSKKRLLLESEGGHNYYKWNDDLVIKIKQFLL